MTVGTVPVTLSVASGCRTVGTGETARQAIATGQGNRVQDQQDLTIAEHRRAVDADHTGKLRANVLDHDFLIAEQFVDLQRDLAGSAAQQQSPVLGMFLR
jgi:hypothetical protein